MITAPVLDRTVSVVTWAFDPASLVGEACTLGGGNLTKSEWQRDVGDQPYRKICP